MNSFFPPLKTTWRGVCPATSGSRGGLRILRRSNRHATVLRSLRSSTAHLRVPFLFLSVQAFQPSQLPESAVTAEPIFSPRCQGSLPNRRFVLSLSHPNFRAGSILLATDGFIPASSAPTVVRRFSGNSDVMNHHPETPNHALQRTIPGLHAACLRSQRASLPSSLSLGSLGVIGRAL